MTENANQGIDLVKSSITYTLTDNVENLTLTGTDNIDGTGNTLNNTIIGNSGINTIDGGAGADTMRGGAGDDTYIVDNTSDVVIENASEGTDTVLASASFTLANNVEHLTLTGNNAINGTGNILNNTIIGNSGSNTLTALVGDDRLAGAKGNDLLYGGAGDDTYIFNLGDGIDTIFDTATPAAPNLIVFGEGIALGDLSLSQQNDILTIHVGTGGDAIKLPNFNFSNVGGSVVVGTLEFADGSTADLATLANRAPIVANPLADLNATEDSAFSFTIPADTITDPDIGDPLSLSVSLSDGSALPGWLAFDAATLTLSGTPVNEDVGSLAVSVSATDAHGLSVADTFSLAVANTNDAPTLSTPIADEVTDEDVPFSYTVPADTFADDDLIHGDILSLSASLSDGTGLPVWLSFDTATGTFSGTPENDDVGRFDIKVTATDTAGVSVSDVLTLTVNNVNDAPVVAQPIPDQTVVEGVAFNLAVDNTFHDDDFIHGDSLSYVARQADGSALPDWLGFNGLTTTFSGTAPTDSILIGTAGDDILIDTDTGLAASYDISVIATDVAGEAATDTFILDLQGVTGDDRLEGLAGNDLLDAGAGDDTLIGGTGNDILYGGTGNDTYLYYRVMAMIASLTALGRIPLFSEQVLVLTTPSSEQVWMKMASRLRACAFWMSTAARTKGSWAGSTLN